MVAAPMRVTRRWVLVSGLGLVGLSRTARAAQSSPPTTYALLIAIGKYRPPAWQPLCAPPNDLALWEDMLTAYGVPRERIRILQDEKATKAAIVAALRALVGLAQSGDTVFIAFSGHGVQLSDKLDVPRRGIKPNDEPDKEDEALVPVDARPGDDDSFLIDDEIAALLGPLAAKGTRVVLLVDACCSQDVRRGEGFDWGDLTRPPGALRTRGARGDEIVLIAATTENERKVQELLALPTRPRLPLSVSALTYSLWARAMQQPGITYGRLLRLIGTDYRRYGLTWRPGLEAPPEAVGEPFLGGRATVGWEKKVPLVRWAKTPDGRLVARPLAIPRRELLPGGIRWLSLLGSGRGAERPAEGERE